MFHVSTSIHVNSVLLRLVHTAYVFYLVNITLCLFHPSVVLYASPHICIAFIHLIYASMHLCGHFASCGRSMSSLNVALNQMMGDDMMWPDMVWKKTLDVKSYDIANLYHTALQHKYLGKFQNLPSCRSSGDRCSASKNSTQDAWSSKLMNLTVQPWWGVTQLQAKELWHKISGPLFGLIRIDDW